MTQDLLPRIAAPTPLSTLRAWPVRRWLVAAGSAVATVLVVGIPC